MSENTKVITTEKPFCSSRWTDSSLGNGRILMSYSVNSVSTETQYSGVARESRKGPTGTFGNSKSDNGCRLSCSHMT